MNTLSPKSGVTVSQVRRGAYHDSIVLMRLQRALAALPGVLDAGVVMATPANREVLAEAGLDVAAAAQARPDDLLIVVRAEDDAGAASALSRVDELLAAGRPAASADDEARSRSLEGAVGRLPSARWVLVSVAGRHAARVAREALALGRHVFLYSDNVPLSEEVALKREAAARGLLVMGPDCGTAIVGGVGFGFANRVRRGSIGIVAASGTGLQAVAARLDERGGGVSHALGTGGRDLNAEVGGATALQALDLLSRDPSTRVIVALSKPPAATVARRLLAAARAAGKDVVLHFIGHASAARRIGNLHFAANLEDAADLALALSASGAEERPAPQARRGFLRGLFAGGTLAYEAQATLSPFLGPIGSNAPLDGEPIAQAGRPRGHAILDLGADEFTVGRLHPMVDQELRLRRLRQESNDPEVGMVLLDVVLGEGSHPDPSAELAPAIAEAARSVDVVVALVGTQSDPQGIETQERVLRAAGAHVFRGLQAALEHCALALLPAAERVRPVALEELDGPIAAVNVGLAGFCDALRGQGAECVQVDWRPPAGGDDRLVGILDRMRSKR